MSITNVNGSVFAFDGIILSDNQISNIHDKLIVSWHGLEFEGSTIQKVQNIHVTESSVIRNTKIISEVDINEIFSIAIDADMGQHIIYIATYQIFVNLIVNQMMPTHILEHVKWIVNAITQHHMHLHAKREQRQDQNQLN